MPSNYAAIRAENERRYGTDIARIGHMLLADRYDDRTHFIFELLQNAEDALSRNSDWAGSRAARFELKSGELRLSHFGKPFDDPDVRGICGIDESSKDRTAIGRFGIGFKSVYAYTSRPEVHSGSEDFAIESFVWPSQALPISRVPNETVILLPLNAANVEPTSAFSEIAKGLQRLGPGPLLFLRAIQEIEWSVDGGPSGIYMRSEPEILGEGIRRVSVIGQEVGRSDVSESWLIFFREVRTEDDVPIGQIEIAFSVVEGKNGEDWTIQAVANSQLVVFFPTVVPTNLGFLVQGPYRTTPSRDNVPRTDLWNQSLVIYTATLLTDALVWLRDAGHLDISLLHCLPLDRSKFPDGAMFAPIFEKVREQFRSTSLLPTSTNTHVRAGEAKLARTQEIRQLFDSTQLGALIGDTNQLSWLSGDISQDRTPEVRQYMIRELDISEVTPEMVLARLDKTFLEAQADSWIVTLYEFLQGQQALIRTGRLDSIPIIRLTDGTHVPVRTDGKVSAFLPTTFETAFPTVRKSICISVEAKKFLGTLGLTVPDPVDDVIWNLVPKYLNKQITVTREGYRNDIQRILAAFGTDSKAQREKLIASLREASFIMAVHSGDGRKLILKPGLLYIPTTRLKDLFSGVKKVFFVDDDYDCLRGEDVRDLLVACGAARSLQTIPFEPEFTWQKRHELRLEAGCEMSSGGDRFTDYSLRGLNELLAAMNEYDPETRARRSTLLWEALGEMLDRGGAGFLTGIYQWTYYQYRSTSFDSAFVRVLNSVPWIPNNQGELQVPMNLNFESLGWKPHPLLMSKIRFRPPIIEALAKEAGIEPGILELLRHLGVTSEADLRKRLGILQNPTEAPASDSRTEGGSNTENPNGNRESATIENQVDVEGGANNNLEGASTGEQSSDDEGAGSGRAQSRGTSDPGTAGKQLKTGGPASSHGRSEPNEGEGNRAFVSYIASHPDEGDGPDPDGLDHQARMDLEERAIKLILSIDNRLQRTPTNNRGFDLCEFDNFGNPVRWVEVKAMKGVLTDRPVCLSKAQFDCAWMHGEAYWLYIVERAGEEALARVLKIQDPAGKGKYFAFDQGWRHIAEIAKGS